MSASGLVVRSAAEHDRAAWFAMWGRYCAFYGADVPQHVSETTWARIIAEAGDLRGLVAVEAASGAVVGFANYVIHPYTWGERPVCYLEDLFVEAANRGTGVGRALIEELLALGKAHGWARVYWLTQEHNAVARRLYDRLAAADDFVRYAVQLGDGPAV